MTMGATSRKHILSKLQQMDVKQMKAFVVDEETKW